MRTGSVGPDLASCGYKLPGPGPYHGPSAGFSFSSRTMLPASRLGPVPVESERVRGRGWTSLLLGNSGSGPCQLLATSTAAAETRSEAITNASATACATAASWCGPGLAGLARGLSRGNLGGGTLKRGLRRSTGERARAPAAPAGAPLSSVRGPAFDRACSRRFAMPSSRAAYTSAWLRCSCFRRCSRESKSRQASSIATAGP